MYRIAYEQGLRTLDDQAAEVDGMRARAVSFMAFIGTATAFLVGTTVRTAPPGLSPAFVTVAVIATGLVAWATFQLVLLVRAGHEFTLRLNPGDIIRKWIDSRVPVPSESRLLRDLSGWLEVYIEKNEEGLDRLRARFNRVIAFGGFGLFSWTVAIWVFGRVGIGG